MQQPPLSPGTQYPQFQKPPLQQWQSQPDYVQPQPHYPPQQYHVPPQYQPSQPPKKKPRKWPWLILVIIVLLLFAGIIISFTARSARNATAPTAQATHPPIQQQSTSQPTSPSTSSSISHQTPVPTVQPTEVPAITHGNPQLDGPISDFIGKYGQPIQSSLSSDSFWADQAQTIHVDVTPQGTIVHEILVSVPGNWSVSQTKTFCEQFLPPDASPFNTTGNVTDYQSSIGEIMMQLGAGSCLLTTH